MYNHVNVCNCSYVHMCQVCIYISTYVGKVRFCSLRKKCQQLFGIENTTAFGWLCTYIHTYIHVGRQAGNHIQTHGGQTKVIRQTKQRL
jgi:hypothetical protein